MGRPERKQFVCVKIPQQRGVLSNVNFTVYIKNMIFYLCFVHFVFPYTKLIINSRFPNMQMSMEKRELTG